MLYYRHASSTLHDPNVFHPEHPDTPDRIRAIEARLEAVNWAGAELREAPAATEPELELVHSPALIARIQEICAQGGGALDDDTFVSHRSYEAARHAAGGALAMTRALLAGEDRTGWCGTRPSGHHAEAAAAMGFCLFNNVALAAQLAISALGAERVMIIDWDVHHGNGTADIFRRRADVLYASIHQDHLYPGTGAGADCGAGPGHGFTVNLPVPAGTGAGVWISLLEHLIVPVGLDFAPDLILVSAGFDAHRMDPLGDCRLEADSFGEMAAHVRELGERTGAPIGAVLEGGYDLTALADSVLATLEALGGERSAESFAADPIFTPRAAARVGHFWDL